MTICDHPRLLWLVAARRPLAHKGISFASRHGGSRQLLRICNGEPDILPRLPTWTVLPQGYGYIDLVRLEVDDVEAALAAIRHTPATIFDIRGYPRGTAWSLGPRLCRKPVDWAVFACPLVTDWVNEHFTTHVAKVHP